MLVLRCYCYCGKIDAFRAWDVGPRNLFDFDVVEKKKYECRYFR